MTAENRTSPITREDVRRLCGDLSDHKVLSILALEPSIAELEAAAAWVAAGSDITGEERPRLGGTTGDIAEILETGQDFLEDDEA